MTETPHSAPYGMESLSAKALEQIQRHASYIYPNKPLDQLTIEELKYLSGMFEPGSSLNSCTNGGTVNCYNAIEMRITHMCAATTNALRLQGGIGDAEERGEIYSYESTDDTGFTF